jgi:lipid-binding SYLF domain-containing protein
MLMRVDSKIFLCSAALTFSLSAVGCASHRTTASRGAGTTTTAATTTSDTTATRTTTATPAGRAEVATTSQTTKEKRKPRTDTAQDVGTVSGEQQERLQDAATAFEEIMSVPDKAIPQDLLDKAQCIVVVPHLKKGAFVVGAQYGKGYFSCRAKSGQGWTPPATVRMEGGSVGFQIGGQETDVVLLVMNRQGQDRLLESQFELGGEASVAGGPVGRTAAASTDAYMSAEMLGYSRARGVFAGVSLKGSTIREDKDENEKLYGRALSSKDIIEGGNVQPPAAAQHFMSVLSKYSARQVS